MKKTLGVLAALAISIVSATAAPTALVTIPIADILGHGESTYGFLSVANQGTFTYLHGFESGFGDHAEFGFDNDGLGNGVVNGKIQLYQSPGAGKYALSVGVQNVGLIGNAIDKYAVARADFKKFRFHAGYLSNDIDHLMLGLDGPMKGCCTGWLADFVSGPDAYTWVALCFQTKVKGLTCTLCEGIPMDSSDPAQHQIQINYGFKL